MPDESSRLTTASWPPAAASMSAERPCSSSCTCTAELCSARRTAASSPDAAALCSSAWSMLARAMGKGVDGRSRADRAGELVLC